jgi:hypothetical protein
VVRAEPEGAGLVGGPLVRPASATDG